MAIYSAALMAQLANRPFQEGSESSNYQTYMGFFKKPSFLGILTPLAYCDLSAEYTGGYVTSTNITQLGVASPQRTIFGRSKFDPLIDTSGDDPYGDPFTAEDGKLVLNLITTWRGDYVAQYRQQAFPDFGYYVARYQSNRYWPYIKLSMALRHPDDDESQAASWVGSGNPDVRIVLDHNGTSSHHARHQTPVDVTQAFCVCPRYRGAIGEWRGQFAPSTYNPAS